MIMSLIMSCSIACKTVEENRGEAGVMLGEKVSKLTEDANSQIEEAS